MLPIKVKLDLEGQKPKVGSASAAGADLRIPSDLNLAPGQRVLVDSGLSMAIPEGYFGLVVPRSSTGVKGLVISNTVGIIDSDYRGNIKLSMYNASGDWMFLDAFERVAQIIIVPHLAINFEYVSSLDETERGSGGFGSTGTK